MRKCANQASHRYTWPGKDESFACYFHAQNITEVAKIMGSHQQMVPLVAKDHIPELKMCESRL